MRRKGTLGLALAVGAATLLSGGVALAEDDDRAATPEELERVRASLEAQGYAGVDDVEVDDGRFELDAISPAGQPVDLELDLATLEILREAGEEEED
jgi:hypothetical protein